MNALYKTSFLVLMTGLLSTNCAKKEEAKTEAAPKESTPKVVAPEKPDVAPEPMTTEKVVAHHLESFGKRDMDAILSDYNADSFLVTPMGTLKGTEQLKAAFTGMFAEFAKPDVTFEMGGQFIEGNVALITWSGDTPDNTYEFATDTFFVADGKIAAQTFASKVTPKAADAAKAEEVAPTPPEGPVGVVLAHHLESFGKGELEAILSDYTEESIIVTPMGVFKGTEQIKALFEGMLAEFAKPGMKFNMRKMAAEGDVAFIVWDGETADNAYEYATDSFHIVDGKIMAQTFAAKITPKTAK